MPNRPGWPFNSRRLPTPPRRPGLRTRTPPKNEVLDGPLKVIHHAPLSEGMISQTTRTEKIESVILAVVFQKSLPAESFGRPANAGPNLEMRR